MPLVKRRNKPEAPDAIKIIRPVRAGGRSLAVGQVVRKGIDLESPDILGLLGVGKAVVVTVADLPVDDQQDNDAPAGEESPRRRGRPRKPAE